MKSPHRLALIALPLLLVSCNTVDTASTDALDIRIAELEDQLERVTRERDALQASRNAIEGRLQGLTSDLTRARSENTLLRAQLDEERDHLARTNSEWQDRLDQFKTASLPDFGDGTTTERMSDGSIKITVPNEILFQPGSEVIGSSGTSALEKVRQALNSEYAGHRVAICGHTDDDPIRRTKNKFDSNMDLSLARANAVYSFLWKHGLENPARVHAVGYGEFQPKADNSTKESKKLNRRVEVIVFAD